MRSSNLKEGQERRSLKENNTQKARSAAIKSVPTTSKLAPAMREKRYQINMRRWGKQKGEGSIPASPAKKDRLLQSCRVSQDFAGFSFPQAFGVPYLPKIALSMPIALSIPAIIGRKLYIYESPEDCVRNNISFLSSLNIQTKPTTFELSSYNFWIIVGTCNWNKVFVWG